MDKTSRPGRPPSPVEEPAWLLVPTTLPERPDMPLSAAGAEWSRIGPYLVALDRIAEIDRHPLMTYCLQWGLFARLMREELAPEQTRLIVDAGLKENLHPQVEPLLDIATNLIEVAGLFGLTARTRDLEGAHGNRKASVLKRLMGNQRKIAEGKLPPSVSPLLPEWASGDMEPPEWMNTRARDEFDRLGRELEHLDLFTPLDLVPIAVYACLVDLELRAYEQMNSVWSPVYDKEGEVVEERATPLLKGIKKISKVARMYWKDYGLTPQYRRKLPGEEQNERAREAPIMFLGGGFSKQ